MFQPISGRQKAASIVSGKRRSCLLWGWRGKKKGGLTSFLHEYEGGSLSSIGPRGARKGGKKTRPSGLFFLVKARKGMKGFLHFHRAIIQRRREVVQLLEWVRGQDALAPKKDCLEGKRKMRLAEKGGSQQLFQVREPREEKLGEKRGNGNRTPP